MRVGRKDVLIVVDVQNDFVSGTMAIANAENIIGPINRAVQLFEHVVLVTDWHPRQHVSFKSTHGGGEIAMTDYGVQDLHNDHCIQGTHGAELDYRLEVTKAELVLRKGYRPDVDSYSAFFENDDTPTGLAAYLKARGLTRVFCAGLARYGCVSKTAVGAAREGFETFLLLDASAGGRDANAGEAMLKEAGVVLLDTESFQEQIAG